MTEEDADVSHLRVLRTCDRRTTNGKLKETILRIAQQRSPNEACGFVVTRGDKAEAVETVNSSHEPQTAFRISADEHERVERMGELKMVWHSHVNEAPIPSTADRVVCESCQLPFLIVALPAGIWDYCEPCGYEAPLLGRPFVHGILDCYSLIRDSFRMEKGIELPDFDRPDDWWHAGGDLYMENFAKAGFRRVEEIQPYDVILMQVGAPVVNHAGIYLGDGIMRHHIQGRISMEVPYVIDMGFYSKHTVAIIRHKSFI